MKEQIKKNCVSVKRFNGINGYISIRIERKGESNNLQEGEDKLVIYVGEDPIVIIPGRSFSSFENAVDEVIEKPHLYNRKNGKSAPEILLYGLYFSIRTWSENNYNSHLLHFKISFPLLKKLREVGETKFQIIFQQEILKRYATGTVKVKGFLEQEGYLKLISDFF
jgi:hypothetical protein